MSTKSMITSRTPISYVRSLIVGGSLALALAAPGLMQAQTPLIQYNFDEGSGTSIANSGSLGTGSGSPDLTFTGSYADHISWASSDSTVSGTGSALVGDGETRPGKPGFVNGDGTLLNTNLEAFTLTMWVNLDSANGSIGDRLFSFYDGINGFELQVNTTTGTTPLSLFVDGSSILSSASATLLNQWTFIAVTYDGNSTSDNVNFYTGGTSVSATMLGLAATLNKGALGTVGEQTTALRVGNPVTTTQDRSPAGMFDNVQVYGSVLDASAIEAIRVSATAIPEPSTTVLLMAGASLMSAVVLRRRRA